MRIFVGGKVFTGLGEDDFCQAFAIDDGQVVWTGSSRDGLSMAKRGRAGDGGGEAVEVVELGGATVLPGLLDMHTHPVMLASLAGSAGLLPPAVTSLGELVDAMSAHRDAHPEGWVVGYGFDDGIFPEGRKPTADDLDAVSTDRPVLVWRCDGHSAVCNRKALSLAGIDATTPEPEHGAFGRDESGELTGLLLEPPAVDLVTACQPTPSEREIVERVAGLAEHFLSHGIVGVCELMATFIDRPLETCRAAATLAGSTGAPLPDIALFLGWSEMKDHLEDWPDLTDEQRTGPVRVAGIKLFVDGAYSDRTAWTEDPYPDSCGHGMSTLSLADLRAGIAWARRNKVQAAFHAMGDRAINAVIDAVGDEEPWMGDEPSVRIDHATLVSGPMLDRLEAATMTFAVVSHTIFAFAEIASYERNLSEAQWPLAYPIRSYYERVTASALSSDCPATAWEDADNVFVSIQAAVNRRAHNGADIGQAQAVTVPQAVLLYTGRARLVTDVGGLGTIAPGSVGSVVVLDRDVFSVPTDEVGQVRIAQTWVHGELAWQAG